MPNYSPSGVIRFGSVPWSNDYSNVRLYGSLSEQAEDISSMMVLSSSSYSYIARERRLKVSIEADRLYHCNYCMYRNESLTDGWIYCFVSEVEYVNDGTTEVTLETDIFQTYLHGVDWTVPRCFVERATVDNEDDYLFTEEPDFPLTYVTYPTVTEVPFRNGGIMVQTVSAPDINEGLEVIMELSGWAADPVPPGVNRGVPTGALFFYFRPPEGVGQWSDGLRMALFLYGMQKAGSIESIVSIFTVPDFSEYNPAYDPSYGVNDDYNPLLDFPWDFEGEDIDFGTIVTLQEEATEPTFTVTTPGRGDVVGDNEERYVPRNKKLLAYPYNFCKVTDNNGHEIDLRYELCDELDEHGRMEIAFKYVPSPSCQIFVYPVDYAGSNGLMYGFATDCGCQGTWAADAYQNWLAQNSGTLAMTVGGVVVGALTGANLIGRATQTLRAAQAVGNRARIARASTRAASMRRQGNQALMASGAAAAGMYAMNANASHQPSTSRGEYAYDARWMSGIQGVWCYKMSVKADIAARIDDFFDVFGYEVDRVLDIDLFTRPSWNYIKTQGAAARSLNQGAGSAAPFARGRGTPAEALNAINECLDAGMTFWHTTSGFGDYSLDNTL